MDQTFNNIVDRQHRLVQFGVAGIAALIAFAESRGDRTVAIVVYGLVPVAIASLLTLWLGEIQRLQDIEALAQHVPNGGQLQPIVSGELRRVSSILPAVQVVSLLASLLAGLLAFRDLRGIEGRVETYDPIWMLMFAAYWIGAVAFVGGLLVLATRSKRKDDSER